MPLKDKNKWLFELRFRTTAPRPKPCYGRAKYFLYETLYRSITTHDLQECYRLLKVLPKETSLDPYILFRFIFILIESNKTESVHKNVITYLESLLSKLDLVKPDIFVEFLSYLFRNNRIEDAKDLFAQRHRSLAFESHRKPPFVNVNLRCYEFLLNYIDWNKRASEQDNELSFDVSMQGWIVNAIDALRSTRSNHEYFVMCVARVLLYHNFHKKAYLFASEFQRSNPDNISAQLILLNLINRLSLYSLSLEDGKDGEVDMVCESSLEDLEQRRVEALNEINNFSSDLSEEVFDTHQLPIFEDRKSILRNLRRLDPSREEIIELVTLEGNVIEIWTDLMNGMEVLSEINNISRWSDLKEVLNEINFSDEETVTSAKIIWSERYERYWTSTDFLSIINNQMDDAGKTLVKEVLSTLGDLSN